QSERHQLLEEFNQTARQWTPVASDGSDRSDAAARLPVAAVHHLFEQQASRHPEALAVVCEEERLTYAELNRRANQLAHHLLKLGVGANTPVGLLLERSAT